jgi:hypothetical protein
LREQRVKLVQLSLRGVIPRKSGGALQLTNGRIKSAVDMLRRAEIAQSDLRLGGDGFDQRRS